MALYHSIREEVHISVDAIMQLSTLWGLRELLSTPGLHRYSASIVTEDNSYSPVWVMQQVSRGKRVTKPHLWRPHVAVQ